MVFGKKFQYKFYLNIKYYKGTIFHSKSKGILVSSTKWCWMKKCCKCQFYVKKEKISLLVETRILYLKYSFLIFLMTF